MSPIPHAKPGTTERLRILVVDDDPLVRKSIRTILERDYDVTEAESIAESLSAFDRQEPDLITLDIYLPDVDGMQGLHHFRQRSAKIPIILISGHATFQLAQEALRLGATDYMTKPFAPAELQQTVKSALARALPEDEENFDLDSIGPDSDLKLRLPLQNLQEEKFLSSRHRSHFLAFAQNALSDKKRTFETISILELIKTITIQFEALRLEEDVPCEIAPCDKELHLDCDMYLLGGALANLVFACMLETRGDPSPFVLDFDCAGGMLRVLYKKSSMHLPGNIVARLKHWRSHPAGALDANTAMLILAEKVIRRHQGEFTLNIASPAGHLLEIRLPLSPSSSP